MRSSLSFLFSFFPGGVLLIGLVDGPHDAGQAHADADQHEHETNRRAGGDSDASRGEQKSGKCDDESYERHESSDGLHEKVVVEKLSGDGRAASRTPNVSRKYLGKLEGF